MPTSSPFRQATIWIDTNVILEVFSLGDFYRDLKKDDHEQRIAILEGRTIAEPFSAAKQRRLRARNSLWMVMALCIQRRDTISYEHEVFRNTQRIAPPTAGIAIPTKILFNELIPNGLFDGWTCKFTPAGAQLSNKKRDRLMVDTCRDKSLLFISRDAGAIEYASTQNVQACAPETYAATVMSLLEARGMFLSRLHDAAILANFAHIGFRREGDWLTHYLRRAIETYGGIWEWWRDDLETR